MSVRNQYAHNHSKVAPMPSTSSHMENIRNAVMRRNMYRGSPELDDVNNRKSKADNCSASKEFRRHSDTGSWQNAIVGKGKVKQTIKSDSHPSKASVSNDIVRHTDLQSKRGDSRSEGSVTSEKKRADHSPEATKLGSRPKSARPESRWQRRIEDIDDEDEELPVFYSDTDSDDISHTTDERPMSARPDSRVARHQATTTYQSNSKQNQITNAGAAKQNADLPPRPKTGHGRRSPDVLHPEYQELVVEQRPRSRTRNKDGYKFEANEKWQRHEQSQSFGNKNKAETSRITEPKKLQPEMSVNDKTYNVHCNEEAMTKTQTPVVKKWSLNAIDNMLFGPTDGLDLDVDPVEFFNTPDPCPAKSSLSKGVINLITHDSSSDAMQYRGNHSNNQNKRTFNSEVNERLHGNGVYSPKNIMGNQGIKSTVQARKAPDSISGRGNYSRDGGSFKKKTPGNPDARVVSLGTGERVHMEFPFKNGQRKKDTRITAISRQPRKLKPLPALQNRVE